MHLLCKKNIYSYSYIGNLILDQTILYLYYYYICILLFIKWNKTKSIQIHIKFTTVQKQCPLKRHEQWVLYSVTGSLIFSSHQVGSTMFLSNHGQKWYHPLVGRQVAITDSILAKAPLFETWSLSCGSSFSCGPNLTLVPHLPSCRKCFHKSRSAFWCLMNTHSWNAVLLVAEAQCSPASFCHLSVCKIYQILLLILLSCMYLGHNITKRVCIELLRHEVLMTWFGRYLETIYPLY